MARDKVCKREFITRTGEVVKTPMAADGMRFTFYDTSVGKPADAPEGWAPPVVDAREVFIDDVVTASGDENMRRAFEIWGVNHKFGDSFAGQAKSEKNAVDLFDEEFETVSAGEWRARRGEGTRGASITILAEAVKRAVKAAGTEVDDAMFERIRASLSTEDAREGAKAEPNIAMHYEEIKLERAQARLKAKQAKAKEAGGFDLSKLGIT